MGGKYPTPRGKAASDAKNRYAQKKYDRLTVLVDKGNGDVVKAHAAARGESVNAFIKRAIEAQIERDNETRQPSS